MPTRYPRIAVTRDPELDAALERAGAYLGGKPAASLVRELALRGAKALEEEDSERQVGIEGLIRLSSREDDLIDWDVLARVDELAWGLPPDDR